MSCKDFEENISLFLYDELSPDARSASESHLAACPDCRGKLEETRKLHLVLARRPSPEPSPELLAQCRIALERALDQELSRVSWRQLLAGWQSAFRTFSPLGASAALALVVFGFGLGWTLHRRAGSANPQSTNNSSIGNQGEDLGNLRINNISQISPSPENGSVRITLDAERRMTLQGSLDDPRIRQVLVDAVKGYDNAGIRRESLDALRAGSNLPSVRDALLYSMEKDPNAGVRLAALQAVREMDWTPEVRKAFVDALDPANNLGVRVAAIDALVEHSDKSTVPELQKLAASDPNRYVRMKSLTALRRLEGNGF